MEMMARSRPRSGAASTHRLIFNPGKDNGTGGAAIVIDRKLGDVDSALPTMLAAGRCLGLAYRNRRGGTSV